MKKKYIYQIAGVFALSGWLTACQNESELPVPETDNAKVCTLTCTMEAGAQSRASVGYGDEDDQTVKWNLGDQILVFQETANPSETDWDPMWFTNTDAEGSTANFKYTVKDDSDPGLVSGRRLCAIYPVFPISEDEGGSEESGQPVAARELNTSDYAVVVSLDMEDGFAILTDNSEVSVKDYQRNHIVMTAAGTVGEESTSLEFKHHTAMFHVVYTNASGSTQQINSIRLKPTLLVEEGDQLLANCYFGTEAEVDCLTGEQETTEFVYQLGLQFTNPVSVENGATAHFYLVSFPGSSADADAVAKDAIDIEVETTDGKVHLGTPLKVEEIVAAAGEGKETGAPLFEAGMRYRFKVTQAGGELRWSKDSIIIDNLPLLRCINNSLKDDNKLIWEPDSTVDVLKNSAQLESLTYLQLRKEPELESLNGIEFCTRLSSLYFYLCPKVTTLDLRNCPWITSVNINGDLQKLLLSDNAPLVSLAVQFCSEFEPLDVNKYPTLRSLIFYRTQLGKELNISKLENMRSFQCSYCQLESLILPDAPLNFLNVSGNFLETLDVSHYSSLESLDVSDNKMQALDVSKIFTTDQWRLYCGRQKDGIILQLNIREDQQSVWESYKGEWSNQNVVLFGTASGGTGPNFGNGGNL